jgi:hypothetical protein
METPGSATRPEDRESSLFLGVLVAIVLIPIAAIGACFGLPYTIVNRWLHGHREAAFRRRMRAQGRMMAWTQFRGAMRAGGGTCIEEKFSAKGPVRLWWTPEAVEKESPHEIKDWFTMSKGGRFVPFVEWCRRRYTDGETGSAVLVDTAWISKEEIFAAWSECKSKENAAGWIEVAPPEIVSRRAGE